MILAAAFLVLAPNTAASQDPEQLAADVLTSARALADAVHQRDRERIDSLLADEFVLRSAPDLDRASFLRDALTLCWGDRSDLTEFRARVRGPVVVASYVLTLHVDPYTCGPALVRRLTTDVWMREGGGWRLTLRHAGPVAGGPIVPGLQPVPGLPPPAGVPMAPAVLVVPGAGVQSPEPAKPAVPSRPTWNLQGEFSFVATAGNASTRTLGLGSDIGRRAERTLSRVTLAFQTSEADAETRARSVALQGRHGVRVSDRMEIFGRVGYSRDVFAGIEHRVTTEAGAAYTARLPAPHALTAEGGVGFTREARLDSPDFRFATASGALVYRWAITSGMDFRDDSALTADLGNSRNWRATNGALLTVALTRLLSLKALYAMEYRNLPVTGFRKLDTRSLVAIAFGFHQRAASQ